MPARSPSFLRTSRTGAVLRIRVAGARSPAKAPVAIPRVVTRAMHARAASRIALARMATSAALALLAFAAGAAHASGLDQLGAFLDGTKSGRMAFIQAVSARNGHAPPQSSGSFAFARPGRFRWSYEKPFAQLIVGDGDKVWVYDRDLNQVIVKKLDRALGSSPAALLAGDNALDKAFDLSDGGRGDGLEWVEARPKQTESGFTRVRLGFRDNLPRTMQLTDAFGQVTTLVFSGIERNPALDASLFRFTAPKGADVVGE